MRLRYSTNKFLGRTPEALKTCESTRDEVDSILVDVMNHIFKAYKVEVVGKIGREHDAWEWWFGRVLFVGKRQCFWKSVSSASAGSASGGGFRQAVEKRRSEN